MSNIINFKAVVTTGQITLSWLSGVQATDIDGNPLYNGNVPVYTPTEPASAAYRIRRATAPDMQENARIFNSASAALVFLGKGDNGGSGLTNGLTDAEASVFYTINQDFQTALNRAV